MIRSILSAQWLMWLVIQGIAQQRLQKMKHLILPGLPCGGLGWSSCRGCNRRPQANLSIIYQRQVPPNSYCSSECMTIPVHLAPLSWTTFQLLEEEQRTPWELFTKSGVIDTPFVTVSVDDNITVYDKTTHEAYGRLYRWRPWGHGNRVYLFPAKRNRANLCRA